jgi:hypothetical protein
MMQSVVPISPIPDEQEQDVINTVLRSLAVNSKPKKSKTYHHLETTTSGKTKLKQRRGYIFIFLIGSNMRVPTGII